MIQDKTTSSSSEQSCETPESRPGVVRFYLQSNRLSVFQFKLYFDAFRDVVLSTLSFLPFCLMWCRCVTYKGAISKKFLPWAGDPNV